MRKTRLSNSPQLQRSNRQLLLYNSESEASSTEVFVVERRRRWTLWRAGNFQPVPTPVRSTSSLRLEESVKWTQLQWTAKKLKTWKHTAVYARRWSSWKSGLKSSYIGLNHGHSTKVVLSSSKLCLPHISHMWKEWQRFNLPLVLQHPRDPPVIRCLQENTQQKITNWSWETQYLTTDSRSINTSGLKSSYTGFNHGHSTNVKLSSFKLRLLHMWKKCETFNLPFVPQHTSNPPILRCLQENNTAQNNKIKLGKRNIWKVTINYRSWYQG